jgi:uncharacterized protein (DUF2267 family)
MDNEEFEKAVSNRAAIPRDRARILIRATLQTLGERLTRGEAGDLASQLPKPLKEVLTASSTPAAEAFGLDEFIRRVSERTGVEVEEATDAVRAVFAALREAVTGGEFSGVMSQLPSEFLAVVGV